MKYIMLAERRPAVIGSRGLKVVRTPRKGLYWLFVLVLVITTKREKRHV